MGRSTKDTVMQENESYPELLDVRGWEEWMKKNNCSTKPDGHLGTMLRGLGFTSKGDPLRNSCSKPK